MVDVGDKPDTLREATASAEVRMSAGALRAVAASARGAGPLRKGDVLQLARLAGLAAVKRTAELIPLCHPLRITASEVDAELDRRLPGVRLRATVRAHDRTGVEMEALCAVTVAALTVYDMTKAVERGIEVRAVRLEHKAGGRSGTWRRTRRAR